MMHAEQVLASQRLEDIFEIRGLLNVVFALLFVSDCAIGRWNLELVLDLLSLERLGTVNQRCEHG